MFDKTTTNSLDSKTRFETRVDHCGQSLFEVWLPVDALEEFDGWFDAELEKLESRFDEFVTRSSDKERSQR